MGCVCGGSAAYLGVGILCFAGGLCRVLEGTLSGSHKARLELSDDSGPEGCGAGGAEERCAVHVVDGADGKVLDADADVVVCVGELRDESRYGVLGRRQDFQMFVDGTKGLHLPCTS